MDTRSMKILAAIVDEYIRTGEPVGSKALAEKPDISVSSATIRNTMAALEQEGYLDHPHTSAGRVPTYKGYRFYIDNLMDPIPLDQADKEQIDGLLEKAVHDSSSSPEEAIVESASAALAEITKCATYSTNHVSQFSVITKVDVIPTGRRMYVLLMITSTGAIKNRVCRMQFDLTNEQMEFFTNFVSKNLPKLIAAAANIGFKRGPPNIYKSPAAIGIPIVLYPNAQNKFCLIFFIVSLLNFIEVGTSIKSLFINTMSADSIATSVPLPIAIPISA